MATFTATEYELLRVLSRNAGRVSTYEALRRQVWAGRKNGDTELVRTYIKKVRKKLGDDAMRPAYILNERGVGHTQESAAEVQRGTPVRCRENSYSRSSTMPDQESLNQRPEALATEAPEMPAVNHANGKREQPLHAPHVVVDRGVPCVRDERTVVDGVA